MVEQQRLIPLDGAMNFRDLGGYHTQNGQTVQWHRIFRADSLSQLSHQDLKRLAQMHVTVDCDLRSGYEQAMAPDRIGKHTRYVDVHVYPDEGDVDSEVSTPHPVKTDSMLAGIYQHVILNVHSQAMFKRVLAELLELPHDEALVYHCSAGKDRTGMMSAIILALLGVDDDTIIRDYLLTNELYDFAVQRQLPTDNEMGQLVAKMNLTKGDGPVMRGFLDTMEQGWGSVREFAQQQLGISKQEVKHLRQLYLK